MPTIDHHSETAHLLIFDALKSAAKEMDFENFSFQYLQIHASLPYPIPSGWRNFISAVKDLFGEHNPDFSYIHWLYTNLKQHHRKPCDHELIVVTRTTVYGEVRVEIETWVQCKFCEHIQPKPFRSNPDPPKNIVH